MLALLFQNPLLALIWALVIIFAITIHEFSHAWTADRLGDPTPRLNGRITLDPRAHLDPLGTLALLAIGFGWGKPVFFDPYNLRNPKKDSAIISLAGPASNILFAIILAVIIRMMPEFGIVQEIFRYSIMTNIMLAIFNLVPVYPLDGEKILTGLLPISYAREYSQLMQQYGTIILILLIFPFGGSSAISALITPIISAITNILL